MPAPTIGLADDLMTVVTGVHRNRLLIELSSVQAVLANAGPAVRLSERVYYDGSPGAVVFEVTLDKPAGYTAYLYRSGLPVGRAESLTPATQHTLRIPVAREVSPRTLEWVSEIVNV